MSVKVPTPITVFDFIHYTQIDDKSARSVNAVSVDEQIIEYLGTKDRSEILQVGGNRTRSLQPTNADQNR